MKFKCDWFLIGMGVAVLLAWLFPDPGAKGGVLHPELLVKAGVALVFFLHGLTLSFSALKAGTLRWPLHLVVQGTTFLVFPLVGMVIMWLGKGVLLPHLAQGFFYLCALPSTVSSSVAMTAAARGNVPAAVFNATLSSLLGIFLTPLWISLVFKSDHHALPFASVILDLVIWLLVPLLLGQLCRPFLQAWATRHKKLIHKVDRLTILMLVYTSFCESVKSGVWTEHGIFPVGITLLGTTMLFALMLMVTTFICHLLKFNQQDKVTVVFCGSKKSLAAGIPMAHLIFGAHPALSLILLPIMIYHPLQLIIASMLASRWARRADAENA